jgi:hypothetical protein
VKATISPIFGVVAAISLLSAAAPGAVQGARLQSGDFALAMASSSPSTLLAQQCLQPGDAQAETRLAMLRTVAGPSQAEPAVYQLHQTDTSEVYWVTDTTTCAQAAIAVARHFAADTLAPPAVYLLRLGPTRFMAWNSVRKVYVVLDGELRHVTNLRKGGYPD